MVSIPETVRTQVDSLIELVSEKKEISFETAAKNLKLPIKTVESWATFLEEEGAVAIKYKFTKPYLVYKKQSLETLTPDALPFAIIDDISRLLKEIPALVKEKKFKEAKTAQDEIKKNFTMLSEQFKSEHPDLISNITDIEKRMDMLIMDFMSKDIDYDEKFSEYKYIDKEFENKVQKLKDVVYKTKRELESPEDILKKREERILPADINQMLKKVETFLESIKKHESKNEYERVKAIFLELIPYLKNLKDHFRQEIGLDKALDDRITKELIDADRIFERMKNHLSSNNITETEKDIADMNNTLTNAFMLLKTLFSEEKLLEKKAVETAELDEIEPLFNKAYKLIKQGRFDDARHIYEQIEGKYRDLPAEFIEKKDVLKIDLIKLNRDLALGMSEITEKQLKEKIGSINKLMKNTLYHIKKSDIASATKTYEDIEIIYKEIPDGYLDEKTKLQNVILELHEKLISKKRSVFFTDLQRKTKEINRHLNRIKNLLGKGKADECINPYQKVREIFATLPQGFLPEKTELQNNILDIYRQILYNKTNESSREVTEKSNEINSLLKTIPNYISKKDIAGANTVYDKVEAIFKSIPDGFLVQKSDLQNSILKVSEKIAKNLDDISSKEFNEKYNKISKMIKTMEDYVKGKNYDLAFAEYEEIITIYNQLPSGFLKKKTELREKLLMHYRNIMRGTDSMLLDKSESAIAKKYDEMLQILIRMHQNIESREFDLWEASYDHLIELYNNMPIGFLQTKTKIIEEVIDMHKKFEMLEMVKKAEEYAKKNNIEDLSNLLNEIYTIYHTLLKKSSEDKQLFDFIYGKYSTYLNLIHGKAHTIQKPHPEHKIKDINNFREKLSTTEKRLSEVNLDYVKPV